MASDESQKRQRRAPYAPWATFEEAVLGSVIKRKPTQVDTVTVRSWTGAARSSAEKQLSALKFLGILDDDGSPVNSVWKSLQVKGEDKFREALGKLVRGGYSDLFDAFDDVAKASDADIANELMARYDVASSVANSSVRFFKSICAAAGIQVGDQKAATREPTKPTARSTAKRETGKIPSGETPGAAKAKQKAGTVAATLGRHDITEGQVPITINIELVLPATDDREVYRQFFRAMKEELLG